jgi:hypothetical protein
LKKCVARSHNGYSRGMIHHIGAVVYGSCVNP